MAPASKHKASCVHFRQAPCGLSRIPSPPTNILSSFFLQTAGASTSTWNLTSQVVPSPQLQFLRPLLMLLVTQLLEITHTDLAHLSPSQLSSAGFLLLEESPGLGSWGLLVLTVLTLFYPGIGLAERSPSNTFPGWGLGMSPWQKERGRGGQGM